MTDAAAIHAPERQKELGAFYTPPAMAAALTDFAILSDTDRVLDPSFGGQVFLAAAAHRLRALGAADDSISRQVFGVDLDEVAHGLAPRDDELGLESGQLIERDFFEVRAEELPAMDAVVGNPPYIRYQGFGDSAERARAVAAEAGVPLTRLTSSWAPFVVHATSFVAERGRLAQVLPAELLHSQYAAPVLEFLLRSFGRVRIAVFEERIFPGALEEVVLLLAEERGASETAPVELVPCRYLHDLPDGLAKGSPSARPGPAGPGREKLIAQLLPQETRSLYESLALRGGVEPLGQIASVDIGIVTGANEFFMLKQDEAVELDRRLLRAGVSKAAHLAGSRLTSQDHAKLLRGGRRAWLFVAGNDSPAEALDGARPHIRRGERAGLDKRYKCRIRDPWWALPGTDAPPAELLLTYCSSEHPRLALNEIGALSTNTLHGVRPRHKGDAKLLAAGFYNSLTMLSAELVGRSYGGGVLKLEPTEAEALLLPPLPEELAAVLPAVDAAVRRRDLVAAADIVDPIVLSPLGLGSDEIGELRAGHAQLAARRRSRGRSPR